MDFGSIKNVGIAAINSIVEERNEKGAYEDFASFCERIKDKGVNRKCVESLIKAGVFDNFGKTRATLLASFETILDVINNSDKKVMENQVSMFDLLMENEGEAPKKQYTYVEKPEFEEKELLSFEKEMIGIYISGHPLEKYRELLEKKTNINTLHMLKINQDMEEYGKSIEFRDNQNVKYAGVITKIKKKFTRNNTIMAFVTIEDLYGTAEIIVFDSVYHKSQNALIEENVVLIEGRLSIREEDVVKIVASGIEEFNSSGACQEGTTGNFKKLCIHITNLPEEKKERLRGAIKFFMGDRANIKLEIVEEEQVKPCGGIYMTQQILEQFEEIVGKDNILLKQA